MRPATTIVMVLLLVALFAAAIVQFVVIGRDSPTDTQPITNTSVSVESS